MADNSEVVQAVAAIYARSATQPQEGDRSLDIQVESCLDRARADGCTVPADFIIREVWSGIDMERPGLNELLSLARPAELQVLYVLTVDRLSRDFVGLVKIVDQFEEYGVRVEFVQGGLEIRERVRSLIS